MLLNFSQKFEGQQFSSQNLPNVKVKVEETEVK